MYKTWNLTELGCVCGIYRTYPAELKKITEQQEPNLWKMTIYRYRDFVHRVSNALNPPFCINYLPFPSLLTSILENTGNHNFPRMIFSGGGGAG